MRQLLAFITVFLTFLYASYIYEYFFAAGATSIKPLYWHILVVAVAAGMTLLQISRTLASLPWWLVVWMWLYTLHGLAIYFYSYQDSMEFQSLVQRLMGVALMAGFLLIYQDPRRLQVARYILVATAVICSLINCYDFLFTVFTVIPGRASGFYGNPNIAGQTLVMIMIASIPVVRYRWRLPFCLLVGLGVFATFSRSAWLMWPLALITLSLYGYLSIRRKSYAILFFGFLGTSFLYALISGNALEVLAAVGLSEHLTADTYARLSGATSVLSDQSMNARAYIAARAWEHFQIHPLLGHGLSYTFRWGYEILPHNMYLAQALEGGIVAVVLFVSLIVGLWRHVDNNSRVLVIIYATSSLFTHNNFEPTMMLLLALIACNRRPRVTAPSRSPYQQHPYAWS